MKIRRGIFGGALLFAAAGCTETTTIEPVDATSEVAGDTQAGDAAKEDTSVDDTKSTDATSPADVTADVAEDTAVADTGSTDVTATDTSIEDASVVDVSVSDTGEHDATVVDVVEDDSPPVEDVPAPMDVSEPVDVADDASGCKLLTIDNALGEKCDEPMSAICDPEAPQEIALLCHDSEWTKMSDLEDKFPFGCFCDPGPDECSYAFAACAVPGFIGLDRAGRIRNAPRRLRLV